VDLSLCNGADGKSKKKVKKDGGRIREKRGEGEGRRKNKNK
jgi:hypothetical protein